MDDLSPESLVGGTWRQAPSFVYPAGSPASRGPMLALVATNIVRQVSLQTGRQLVREVNDRMPMTVALIKALAGKWGGPPDFHARTTFLNRELSCARI